MTDEAPGKVPVTFAKGVLDDVAELTQESGDEAEAVKHRIAELLVECKDNPFIGELMGSGLHPELANCRRVRFDIPTHKGMPRFRLIYRNEPTDGAPAECHWLTGAPEGQAAVLSQTTSIRVILDQWPITSANAPSINVAAACSASRTS